MDKVTKFQRGYRMNSFDYPVLCGGTFFTLMLEARKDRTSKRGNAVGDTDGLSQVELFIELTRMIKPTFSPPAKESTLNKNVGSYRQCADNGGTYFAAVFESNDVEIYDERMNNEYIGELSRTHALTERFISEEKAEWLIKAIIDVISADEATKEASFIIDGKSLSRNEVMNIDSVTLPGFILGVWHYVTQKVKDNTVGQTTFAKWHRKKGEINSEWLFDSDIGNGIKRKITVLPFEPMTPDSSIDEQSDPVCNEYCESDEPFIIDESSESEPEQSQTNQTVIIKGNLYNAKNQVFGNIDKLYIG